MNDKAGGKIVTAYPVTLKVIHMPWIISHKSRAQQFWY